MPRKKEEEWITGREAVKILSENSGRPISQATLRNMAYTADPPRIRTKRARDGESEDRRTALYNRADVEKITVRKRETKAKTAS